MNTLSLVGALFVSVAVIITVAGELTHLLEFFKIGPLTFNRPKIAFFALLAVIFLLSAIVTTNVVSGSDAISLANEIATFAVIFSFLPWAFELISLVSIAHWPGTIVLFIIGVGFGLLIFPFRSLLASVSPLLPLATALVFAAIPLITSYQFPAPIRN